MLITNISCFWETLLKKLSKLLLVLSFTTATLSAATTTMRYKTKSGDSLYSIAKKNHTSVAKLRQVNCMKKGDILKVGKVLSLPTNKNSSLKLSKYRIKKGDNLSSIARKHHTTIKKLTTINSIKTSDVLKSGQTIKVPKTTYRLAKKKKSSSKKLLASLSNLDTVSLKSSKRSHKITLSDIFNTQKTSELTKSKKIEIVAKKKLGKRYVWGASGTKNTYDCSSFTKYVYRKNGISIPRTSIKQSKYGKYVKRKDLKKGDLIFFDTSKRRKGYVNHVGIYLGDNKFIHASSAKKKVVITRLDKKFYSQRYKGARRPS